MASNNPILVLKGMLEGCIATWDLRIYACQKSAWMDEVVMLKWVEQVLKPQILNAPMQVDPLLPLPVCGCGTTALPER